MRTAVAFIAVLVAFVSSQTGGFAATQTVQFDLKNMFGDGSSYLFSTSNAEVFTESFGANATYWQPSASNTAAEVTYKVDFPFVVQSANLTALTNTFFQFAPNAYSYLDISTDGTNWVTIQEVEQHGDEPFTSGGSISSIVAGSQSIFVRNRFLGINQGTFSSSQFLRTETDDSEAPFVLVANDFVPEPHLAVMLFSLCFFVVRDRR